MWQVSEVNFLFSFPFLMKLSSCALCCCAGTLGEEKASSVSRHWGIPGQELLQRPWRDAAVWLASSLTSTCPDNLGLPARVGSACVDPPPSVSRSCPQASLMEAVPQPSPSSQMTLVCVDWQKLTSTAIKSSLLYLKLTLFKIFVLHDKAAEE